LKWIGRNEADILSLSAEAAISEAVVRSIEVSGNPRIFKLLD